MWKLTQFYSKVKVDVKQARDSFILVSIAAIRVSEVLVCDFLS